MYNLMVFLNESYKHTKNIVPANKLNVFSCFEKTQFANLKVVLMNTEPSPNYFNNGLALGVKKDINTPPLVNQKVRNCIEKQFYNGINLHYDYSLESWAKQGVLLLNCALTNKFASNNAHVIYWRKFTREVIKSINDNKTGIIFILLGNEARSYKKFIDTDKKHHVLEYHNPVYSVVKGQDWNCPSFKQCNDIIRNINGESEIIKW